MMHRALSFFLIGATLAACQSPEERNINSAFRTPDADGLIRSDLNVGFLSGASLKEEDADGDGFAYAVGGKEEGGFAGYAGILASTRVGASPTSGSASFAAEYTLLEVTDINVGNTFVRGETNERSGDITLQADFAADTLRGTSADGLLRVRGTLSDRNSIGGDVTYRGVDGDLRGAVSDREIVGAFHGHNEDTIFAGGFLGDAP